MCEVEVGETLCEGEVGVGVRGRKMTVGGWGLYGGGEEEGEELFVCEGGVSVLGWGGGVATSLLMSSRNSARE